MPFNDKLRAAPDTPGLCHTISEIRAHITSYRREHGGIIGLVPTMGYFHEGHLSLMRDARANSGLAVVSIFVNPTQFSGSDDLHNYPRDPGHDLAAAGAEGIDLVFSPEEDEMYPPGHETTIDAGSVAEGLCGHARPGHFQGVATVVAKLFNIIKPDAAWFGQKDAQQVAVIKRMVKDLDFDVDIRVCPTIREADGLAMSSRNTYLTPEEREQAPVLFRTLEQAREQALAGETNTSRIRRQMRKTIAANYIVELEYARIVDPETMQPVDEIEGEALAVVAAQVGRARLIDNMLLKTNVK